MADADLKTGCLRRWGGVLAPAPARSDVPSGSGRGGRRHDDTADLGHALLDALIALGLCGLVVPPTLAVAATMVSSAHRIETRLAVDAVGRDAAHRVLAEGVCADPAGLADLAAGAATAIGWPAATVTVGPLAAPVVGDDGTWRWTDSDRACARPAQMARITVRSPDGAATIVRDVVVVALPAPS